LDGCSDVRMSRVFITRPVGSDAGGDFLNAAAVLHTGHSAAELLQRLHLTETRFKRVRTRHWGPRTLDLDLILYGTACVNDPGLVVPHPAMWYRRFVLEPASEVAGPMIHPLLNESVAQLYARLTCRPLRFEICGAKSMTESGVLQEILHRVRNHGDSIEWSLANTEICIAPPSFARILVRSGAQLTTQQPFNRTGREIEIVGESVPDIVMQIENLMRAVSG
ncbi:MAG: 2-amino-4-hydroxy-6-hydroxymethyldihydropteridine diphosphokinase, partial [Planctomycetaceae bacterium]|nr:2-amino-4-hydroxy-6-hydroxymethyldihydropteridine diphosphokinase [Planctomycetaceae bacterium]